MLEVAGRDPIGGALEPPDSTRKNGRGAVADEERQPECDETRPEQASPHEVDVFERVPQRRGDQQDVAVPVGDRGFGVGVPAPLDAGALDARSGHRAQGDRIADDVLREREVRRVEDRRQGGLATAERVEVHDPGVGCAGLLVHEVLVGRRRGLPGDRPRRAR